MRRALRAKNKLGFISGSIVKPVNEEDPLFEMWERCNDMVISWIQNAVSIDIKHTLAFVDDAQMVWTELKDRFTQQNGPRIFQLRRDLATLRQDKDSVSTYFGNLKTLWDEMVIYNPMPLCTCGQSKVLNERDQRDYVIQFLMGLNDQYANARDQIMLIEPLPSINKVFSLIQQQEQHHQLIINTPSCESMALASKFVGTPFKPVSRGFARKERPYCQHCRTQGHTFENCYKAGNVESPVCSHCNASGHMAEKCYKLHGYPPGHKLYKGRVTNSFANQAILSTSPNREKVSEEKMVFTKEQYHHLMSLIQPKGLLTAIPSAIHTSSNSNTSATPSKMSGKIMFCSDISSDFLKSNNVSWIIDSGATDHMVCSPSFFISDITKVSYKVSLPNDTFVLATHLGDIQLTNNIVLNDVLCIPSFSFNLISVKRLTESLTCCLVFINDTCFIQDLSTWTTIGIAEVRSGLYHLLPKAVSPSSLTDLLSCLSPNFPSVAISVKSSMDVNGLWHCRLGHISDSRMKLIDDPVVRDNLTINETSPCCICPLAKQHRLPFPISSHKSSSIFELVHCDIWGPCSTNAYDGSRYFLTLVDDLSRTTWVYLLQTKSETRKCIESFYHIVETQFNCKIKNIRSDNGAEFKMSDFYSEKGIIHQRLCRDTPAKWDS